jgi:hypothetical protein
MSVTRRGAGCGSLGCGRRPHARHGFKPRPAVRAAGRPVEECPPGTLEQTCKTPRAERRNLSAFRGDFARVDTKTTPHEAAGRLKPGVPRALHWAGM